MQLKGRPKKAIEFKINDYPNIQFIAGTEDRETLKGCYLEIKGQFKSLSNNGHVRNISKLTTHLKWSVEKYLNDNKSLFKEHIIINKDLSDSYEETGNSYTKFEFTIFPKRKTSKEELTQALNELSNLIYDRNIKDNKSFEIYKRIQIKNK